MFWEREPFVWDEEEARVSRFVSLGAFGGEPTAGKKQRVGPSLLARDMTQESYKVVLCVFNGAHDAVASCRCSTRQRDEKPVQGNSPSIEAAN
jgi:hypothetical protein